MSKSHPPPSARDRLRSGAGDYRTRSPRAHCERDFPSAPEARRQHEIGDFAWRMRAGKRQTNIKRGANVGPPIHRAVAAKRATIVSDIFPRAALRAQHRRLLRDGLPVQARIPSRPWLHAVRVGYFSETPRLPRGKVLLNRIGLIGNWNPPASPITARTAPSIRTRPIAYSRN